MITLEQDTTAQTACACGAAATRITSPFATVGLTTYSYAFLCTACSRVEFAPADPQGLPIRATSRRVATPCNSCGGPINELLNPYYSVKPAMSPTIRFCPECDQA